MPRFPSALRREQGGSGPAEHDVRKKEASAKQLALMNADQYKAYMQRKGEWQEPDREAISKLNNPSNFDRRNL